MHEYFLKYKKRLLLGYVYTILKPNLINNKDHVRILGAEPSWITLSNQNSLKMMLQMGQNQMKPEGMV